MGRNLLGTCWFAISSIKAELQDRYERLCNKFCYELTALEFFLIAVPAIQLFMITALIWLLGKCWTLFKKSFSKCHRQLEKFNGPKAYPVIGTVRDMIFTGLSDFWEWSNEMCKKWGDPLRLWKFGHPMVFISSCKYANQLLWKSEFNGKLKDLDMIYRLPGGKGLSTIPAQLHSQKRKLLNHAFSRQIVEGSMPAFCEETIKLCEKLEKYARSGEQFDMVNCTMKCLFQMVVRSDFGDAFSTDDISAQKHMNALRTIAIGMSERMFSPNPLLKRDFIYYHFTVEGKQVKKAGDILNGFATDAINGRRLLRTNGQTPADQGPPCYLDLLLNLVDQGLLTDEDVVSELNNFMGGAYDTTTLAVCWTLLLLALNPSCQQKVYDEVSKICNNTSLLTPSDTKHMKYLELCLKEALRLFPPAPIFPRSTPTDITLDDGRIIPADTDVLIFANLIQRDPKYFTEPEKFIPERHLEPNPAFMPFSLGVRNCIGQTYGMYQSKVVLAYLCRDYLWETDVEKADDVKIKYQGLLYPANGLHFKVTKR